MYSYVYKLVSMSKPQANTTYYGNIFHSLIIGFVNKIFLLSVLKINIYDMGIQSSKLIMVAQVVDNWISHMRA